MPNFSLDTVDDTLSWAFQQDFSGGEDSFRRSTLIDDSQCQHLLNVIVRDNYEARTRAGADALPTVNALPVAGTTAARTALYFDTQTYQQLLVSLDISGTPGFAKYEGNAWTDLSGLWAPSASDSRPAMAQGINKVLISDGVGVPQIYDGATFVATGTGTPANDAPLGCTILCWHTARMFASGVSGFPDTVWVSNLLSFADGQWSTTTRSFQIGVGDGDPVVAMASMQATVMCILKANSIWLVDTNPALDSTDTPVKITGFTAAAVPSNIGYGIGCVGRDAWCNYANDILFMAQDGVRSVQRMQAAAGQWQLSAPISQPIQPLIARINPSAWQNIVSKKYQEFAFFFVPLDNSLTNNYVLIYNGRLQKWMGAWTNWNGLCVEVTRFNRQPHLVFGDTSGHVNQWKDLSSTTDDATYLDNGLGYPTQIWPKSWQFGELICNKTGYNLQVRFTQGNANVQFYWVCDGAILKTWTGTFAPTGDILGVGTLPFLLQTDAASVMPQGVRGLVEFNEAYLRIETKVGWIFLRSVAAGAFVNGLTEVFPS